MEMIERKCHNCGKVFSVRKILLKFVAYKYCSLQCYTTHKPKVLRNCKTCGKEFFVQPHRLKVGRGLYCSKQCQFDSMKRVDAVRIYGDDWDKQRRLALERDKYTCQMCKKHKSELPKRCLHVHHKIKRRLIKDKKVADSLDNLITLCVKCHHKLEKTKNFMLS